MITPKQSGKDLFSDLDEFDINFRKWTKIDK